jgi:hypothetical protein
MRAMLGMHSRFDRCFSLVPALVGAVGLLLTACQSDGPTGAGSNDSANAPAVAFPMASGAGRAATTATHQVLRVFPTVQLMSAKVAQVTGSDARLNSPFDLTDLGGPVVTHATNRNVYVNCASNPATCWGTGSLSPATFLRDLDESGFLRIADQYLGEDATDKFLVAELKTTATFKNHTATINDILGIVFSASAFTNASGYDNIFHVFLPQGTDMCVTATNCYSPDNPQTFAFCAFHGSVDFSATQHVLFSVEPFQAVGGCTLPAQTRVIDATASTLSHEFIETITDPDGDAWFNLVTGMEIGDLCFAFRNPERVFRHIYVIQEEYSNAVRACTDAAAD